MKLVDDLSYAEISSVNILYHGYIEESKGKKYLTLVSTDESWDIQKKYEKLWDKIRYIIRSVTNNSDNYGEKHENQI